MSLTSASADVSSVIAAASAAAVQQSAEFLAVPTTAAFQLHRGPHPFGLAVCSIILLSVIHL